MHRNHASIAIGRLPAARTTATPIALALAGVLAALALPVAAGGPDVDKVMGGITAEPGQRYGELSTVNGGIRVEAGAKTKDVSTVNGGIRVAAGAQIGDAETVNGGVRIAENVGAGKVGTVNGGIRVGARSRVKDLETVNGGVFVDRGTRISNDIETVNGAIGIVATEVDGDIVTVNGDVTVGVGSRVHGGLRVKKPSGSWAPANARKRVPRIVIAPGAVVMGPMKFEREVKLYVHRTATVGKIEGATAIRYDEARAPQD